MTLLRTLFDNISTVFDFLLALFTGYIAVLQYLESRYNTKVENMVKANDSLLAERSFYTQTALALYRAQYGPAIVEDAALIAPKDWLPQTRDDLVLLRDVSLRLVSPEPWADSDRTRARILRRILPDRKESFAWEVKFHLHKNLFSLPLFALAGVERDETGRPRLALARGEYFDFYNTCESVAFETAYVRRVRRERSLTLDDLPLRSHQRDLFDLANRFPGIGIDTLTIFHNLPDENGQRRSYFLLHKRSSTAVAEGPGAYHCVPAGSFQPTQARGALSEFDAPQHTVLREFAEELMGMEECAELNAAELYSAFEIGEFAAHLYYLGIGFEPLNTKAELLSALMLDLDDERVAGARFLRGCRNVSDVRARLNMNYEGAVTLKPLTTAFVRQYAHMSAATPSFRQIMQIVLQFPDFFGVESDDSVHMA